METTARILLALTSIMLVLSVSAVFAYPSVTIYSSSSTVNGIPVKPSNYVSGAQSAYNPSDSQYFTGYREGYQQGSTDASNVALGIDRRGPGLDCRFGADDSCLFRYVRCGDSWCRIGDAQAPAIYTYYNPGNFPGVFPLGHRGYYNIPITYTTRYVPLYS